MNRQAQEALIAAVRRHQAGDLQTAEQLYSEALALDPGVPEAHCNLGMLLLGSNRLEPAAEHLRRAATLNPGMPQAWNNLGVALRRLEQVPAAIEAFRKALALAPGSPGTHHNLAQLLRAQGDFAAALPHAQQAARHAPADPATGIAVGDLLLELGRPGEAADWMQRLAAGFPDHSETFHCLGRARLARNELEAAAAAFKRAIQLDPQQPEPHFSLGLALLLGGDFESGFREYEWRFRLHPGSDPGRRMPGRPWTGESLEGRSLLLFSEQGLGDAIHFARYIPLLPAGRIILSVPDGLHRILSSIDAPIAFAGPGDLPAADYHASMMSLALRLGTTLETIPAKPSYLRPTAARVDLFKQLLGPAGRPRVGLCWHGNPRNPNDRRRSIPIEPLAGLAQDAGAEWTNLQVPATADDLAFLPRAENLTRELGDLDDTAALIENLDLVVTVDTVVAHLAGAIGKPVFLLLPFAPDWRWLLDRSDNPWYPTVRIFRQPEPGDWSKVIREVSEALQGFLGTVQAKPRGGAF